MKCVAKLIPAISMNTIATISTATESKCAKPSSQVEKPPSPMVVAMWHQASNQDRPASRYARKQRIENTKYTAYSALAVLAMRGVSRSSFIGPGVSARTTWWPPTPSRGRMATASTRMPMPPIQISVARHRLIDGGKVSRLVRTVAPVVVSPDIASK